MSESSRQQRIVLGAFALAATLVPLAFSAESAVAQSEELTPVVSVAPSYPPRALSRGRNGAVTLRFTIAADGTTKDIEVVDSSSCVFERPATAALSQWRYAPRLQNGAPIEQRGVETVIRFSLGNGRGG